GRTFELNQLTAPNLRNNINSACGTLVGVPNHAKVLLGNIRYVCNSVDNIRAELKNLGNNPITSAVLVLKENGTVVSTQNYSGNVSQFSKDIVTFDPVSINQGSTYTVEIQSINGNSLHHSPFGVAQVSVEEVIVANAVTSTNLEVRVYTDNYPTEATWRIKNSAGTIVANGGPYSGPANGGGVNANTTKIHTITIPSTADCY